MTNGFVSEPFTSNNLDFFSRESSPVLSSLDLSSASNSLFTRRKSPGSLSPAMSSVGSNSSNLTEENDLTAPIKVLVIDDDQLSLQSICAMLELRGYEATKCTSGTEGLKLLRQNNGMFDIVLADVHMPDMDGFRLLQKIGLEMALSVIMLTNDSSYESKLKGLKHGACDYLIKPVKIGDLENIGMHVMNWRKANAGIIDSENMDDDEDEDDNSGGDDE